MVSCVFNSATQLTANLAIANIASPGTRTVTVTNPDTQTASLSNAFTVTYASPAPVISALNPNSGLQGQNMSVVISGSNFQSGATCAFGAGITVSSCAFNSSTQLTASIAISTGAATGARTVTVTNPDGQSNGFSGFSVTQSAPPPSPTNGVTHIDFNYTDRNALLADGWSYTATSADGSTWNTEQSSGSLLVNYDQTLHPGRIRIPVGSGELWQDSNNSQNLLVHDLPSGWTSVRLKIAAFNPVARDQETGLLIYSDDDDYVNLNRIFGTAGSVVELFTENAQATSFATKRSITNTGNLILRIDRNASTSTYSGFYSVDGGSTWTSAGSMALNLSTTKLAIQVGGNSSTSIPNADLAWIEIIQPAPSAPAISLSSTSLTFTDQQVGTTSPPQAVTLTNTGTTSLTVSNIVASGDYAQSNNCPAALNAGTSCSITITFAPTVAGTRTGSVTITDNAAGSPHVISLTGNGSNAVFVTSVTITPQNAAITPGATVQLTAIAHYSDGSTQILDTSSGATWTSTNPSAATVSSPQGLVTGVATGNATIQATYQSVTGSANLTVKALTITPAIATLTHAQSQQQFQASVDGVTWSTDVGTISPTGFYSLPSSWTGSGGTIQVTATNGAQTATASVVFQDYAGVFTWHNDNGLTGQNLSEIALTPVSVNSTQFGKLFSYPVDGYVYAQPLYVANLNIPGVGPRNVVFVATEHDSVYAFDADHQSASPLWQVSFINPANGITSVPNSDVNCNDLVPEIGITGTPVIDPATGTLYVAAKTKENGQYFTRLHALDITTGAEKFGGPVTIIASAPTISGGQVSFDALLNLQRSGLLLNQGNVYISFASHCDGGAYHGWVIAYDAGTLSQTSAFVTTPDGAGGGIWMSAASPSADVDGNIYAIVGNGTFDADVGGSNVGDSFLKLDSSLNLLDYFTPFNQDLLSTNDWDLGSSGAMLLPDQTGIHPHLMIGAGKQRPATLYLVDRDGLGQFQSDSDSQIVQEIPGAFANGILSTSAYWNGNIYFAGNKDVLKSYQIANGLLSTSPTSQDSLILSFPGATPAISANGNADGIVWIMARDTSINQVVLRAYDANDVSRILYDSKTAGVTTAPPVKFAVPTIANGKLYVGTQNQLIVFGLH